MIAYFVHDTDQGRDLLVIPETGCTAAVDERVMGQFIAPVPHFAGIEGDSCAAPIPEDFGTVIATREEEGDVCVRDAALWQARMAHHLGKP
jgi:hypothetical protein